MPGKEFTREGFALRPAQKHICVGIGKISLLGQNDFLMQTKNISKKLVLSVKRFFANAGKKKAVLGLSGGIDSAVCAVILVKALGKRNVSALLLPAKGISSEKNLIDAKNLAKSLCIRHYVLELTNFMASFKDLPWLRSKTATTTTAAATARQNLFARQRAVILYSYANSTDSLVCGTGNKSEILLGYFTKFGDAAADFLPIGGLYKSQVREMARHFGLPKEFLQKAPSAELWEGQTDEGEIGVKYEEIDQILGLAFDEKKTKTQVIRLGHAKKDVERVFALFNQNRHKRELPPIL